MATTTVKKLIQVSPELRKELKKLKAEYDVDTYEEVLRILLDKKGF